MHFVGLLHKFVSDIYYNNVSHGSDVGYINLIIFIDGCNVISILISCSLKVYF